ncbi:6-phosphogluconolactonase [Dyella sp.]|uniref:6-phosphogluconolactonase n=1 Tax=Dyella sp. TaxID=1869338 RepID=UPI002ED55530
MPDTADITQHSFTDCHALAKAFAERVAGQLRDAIATRDKAVIAVSGGSTPKHFFEQLSRQTLDWARVAVTLVDERWVPETSDRSNARLVKSLLLQREAATAQFVPLYADAPTPEAGLPTVKTRLGALGQPFDVVILGMGSDGHTASFFPGGDRLGEALDLHSGQRVVPMRAEGAGEPRITFSLPALLDTRALYLHIEGESKREVLNDARIGHAKGASYPIRAVLAQHQVPLSVYWCP